MPALAVLRCVSCLDWQISFHIVLPLTMMRSCSNKDFHLWFIICPWVILLKSSGLCLSLCIRVLQILLSEIPKAFLKYFSETRKQWVNISKTSQILGCSFPLVRRKEKGEVFTSNDIPEICKTAVICLLMAHICKTLSWWLFIFRFMFLCRQGYCNAITLLSTVQFEKKRSFHFFKAE